MSGSSGSEPAGPLQEKSPQCQGLRPSLSSGQISLWPPRPLLVLGLTTNTEDSLGAWESALTTVRFSEGRRIKQAISISRQA